MQPSKVENSSPSQSPASDQPAMSSTPQTPEPHSPRMVLPRRFLRTCRRFMRSRKVSDSTRAELTGAGLLMRSLILRRLLRRELLAKDESYVGLLLPPSVAGLVLNAALGLDRRIAVNLNYTVTSAVMNDCIHQCGIRHVLTSRRVIERFPLQLEAEVICLEDLKDKITLGDKLLSALATWTVPAPLLERWLGLTKIQPDDLLTVIFTSGSTGRPKGVMLTQDNVASNIDGFNTVLDLRDSDVMLGILPLFHSFGYTGTMWTALTLGIKAVYHYTPLEPKQVAQLTRQYGATILVATPTFLRSYIRRCEPEDFRSLEVVITGAEKLPAHLAEQFENRFGIYPLEGYGTTELSPVVSCNIPPGRGRGGIVGQKQGTVGRPIPGVSAKVVDLETGEDLSPNQPGMLLITGPNVMKGYLDRPDLTAEVLRDGWYVTGDVAVLDEEGFIHITGRQSRFSKIGGEMVPHIRVEEAIVELLHLEDDEQIRVAVTAVSDVRKGERLVVLHTGLELTPEQICRRLAEAQLPTLWIPGQDAFYQIESLPLLGTGKLDLKRLREIAEEVAGVTA